jgi:hypothetical protein
VGADVVELPLRQGLAEHREHGPGLRVRLVGRDALALGDAPHELI